MANLKDTIVLGNLTVTGMVTASSIFTSGNNCFNSIIVPNQSTFAIDFNNSSEDKLNIFLDTDNVINIQASDGGGNSAPLKFGNDCLYTTSLYPTSHRSGRLGTGYNRWGTAYVESMHIVNLYPHNSGTGDSPDGSAGYIGASAFHFAAGYFTNLYMTSNNNLVATQAWVNTKLCLAKDTRILMSDGTEKPIQDIQKGDFIMGYDFENNQPVESIVMYAVAAQTLPKGTYVVFSNDEVLCMTDRHYLYSVEWGRYLPINDFFEGDHVLNQNGEEVEIMAIYWDVETKTDTQFYHLVSSNNTYFANNILQASPAIDKYRFIHDIRQEEIPQDIVDLIMEESKDTACMNFTVTNPEFVKISTPLQYQIKKAWRRVDDLEKYLKSTEYVLARQMAGRSIENDVLQRRADAYEEIDSLHAQMTEWEQEYNQLLAQYSELGEDILLDDRTRREKYFKAACKLDNEKFLLYKYYYDPNQDRPEEEGCEGCEEHSHDEQGDE